VMCYTAAQSGIFHRLCVSHGLDKEQCGRRPQGSAQPLAGALAYFETTTMLKTCTIPRTNFCFLSGLIGRMEIEEGGPIAMGRNDGRRNLDVSHSRCIVTLTNYDEWRNVRMLGRQERRIWKLCSLGCT
jgi:hypothetical protein